MADWSIYGANDNQRKPRFKWYEKTVSYLERYKAPLRCAMLCCLGCGDKDVYNYYVKNGTEYLTCRKCGTCGTLTEKYDDTETKDR
jgi:hypothetical protein